MSCDFCSWISFIRCSRFEIDHRSRGSLIFTQDTPFKSKVQIHRVCWRIQLPCRWSVWLRNKNITFEAQLCAPGVGLPHPRYTTARWNRDIIFKNIFQLWNSWSIGSFLEHSFECKNIRLDGIARRVIVRNDRWRGLWRLCCQNWNIFVKHSGLMRRFLSEFYQINDGAIKKLHHRFTCRILIQIDVLDQFFFILAKKTRKKCKIYVTYRFVWEFCEKYRLSISFYIRDEVPCTDRA